METFAQYIIFICGIIVAGTIGRKDKWQRWSYIFILISEPFWFYTSYINGQWGIFLTSLIYTYGGLEGIKNYWLKPKDLFGR